MAYTEVSLQEAQNLVNSAGRGKIRQFSDLAGGWANSNYLVTLEGGEELVLKVWDERLPEEVSRVVTLTCWLADHGLATPVPLMLENGKRTEIRDGKSWMLMPYVRGGWLPATEKSMYDLGRVQAEMHQIPVHQDVTSEFAIGFPLWKRLISEAKRDGMVTPFIELLERELADLKEKIPDELPRGMIHGDIYPDNVIGVEGKVLAILDFEEVCVQSLALDLVTTYVGFGWRDGLPVAGLWDALLAGYESVRPLTAGEKRALPDLHRYAVLAVAAWRYWQFVINVPNTEHTDRYVEMVERLDKDLPF